MFRSNKIRIEHATLEFIDFLGTETADISKNLTTLQGTGSVQGPKTGTGWTFYGMAKIRIKDATSSVVEVWTPLYKPDAA